MPFAAFLCCRLLPDGYPTPPAGPDLLPWLDAWRALLTTLLSTTHLQLLELHDSVLVTELLQLLAEVGWLLRTGVRKLARGRSAIRLASTTLDQAWVIRCSGQSQIGALAEKRTCRCRQCRGAAGCALGV